MNINVDIEIRGKNPKKWKGYANKISYISAATCSILPIWYQVNAKTTTLFSLLLVVLVN